MNQLKKMEQKIVDSLIVKRLYLHHALKMKKETWLADVEKRMIANKSAVVKAL